MLLCRYSAVIPTKIVVWRLLTLFWWIRALICSRGRAFRRLCSPRKGLPSNYSPHNKVLISNSKSRKVASLQDLYLPSNRSSGYSSARRNVKTFSWRRITRHELRVWWERAIMNHCLRLVCLRWRLISSMCWWGNLGVRLRRVSPQERFWSASKNSTQFWVNKTNHPKWQHHWQLCCRQALPSNLRSNSLSYAMLNNQHSSSSH